MRILLLIAALFALALPTVAQDATPESTDDAAVVTVDPANAAHVRFANLSPDTEPIDVYINGLPSEIADIEYREFSPWINVTGGISDVTLVPTDAADGNAVINPTSTNFPTGTWTTVAVLGSFANGTLMMQAIEEDTTELVPGTARLIFLHAIENGPLVNIHRDDIPYVTSMSFPNAYTIVEDSGTHVFQAVSTGNSPVVLDELDDPVQIESYTYFIVVTGTSEDDVTLIAALTDPAEYAVGDGTLPAPGTVIDALNANGQTGDLASAIEAAGLTDELNAGGEFTIFAPLDFAQSNLGAMSAEDLANLLQYHVVPEEVMSQQLAGGATLTTLNGSSLNIRTENGRILVNDAEVIDVNIPATNGVIHLINGVLTPSESASTQPVEAETDATESADATEAASG